MIRACSRRTLGPMARVVLSLSALIMAFSLSGCPEKPWPKCEKNEECRPDKEGNPKKKQFYCL